MKFLVVSVAVLLSTAASAETYQYRVLFGGDDVGGLEVETAGNTSNIEFDYKQNGRGPTIAEKVGVDAEGIPTNWTITGRTTFGNPVNESYACADGKASWQDSTGPGSADACSFYIDQTGALGASPCSPRPCLRLQTLKWRCCPAELPGSGRVILRPTTGPTGR